MTAEDIAVSPAVTLQYRVTTDRRILLLHGCNTQERTAQTVMTPVRDALSQRCGRVGSQILTMTWPGDRPWWRGGIAAYPLMERKSVAAGRKLSEYFREEYAAGLGAAELVFVAHSLGCRLALEMAAELMRSGRPAGLRKLVLILMAAAVPTDLKDLIAEAKTTVDELVVLHSDRDRALKIFFPLATARSGSEAVGYRGNPTAPAWSFSQQMDGYDHEHYWRDARTIDVLAERLQFYFPDLVFRQGIDRENTLGMSPFLSASDMPTAP